MGSDKTKKKRLKAEIKRAKAEVKATGQQSTWNTPKAEKSSPAVRFAEGVRGILYLIGSGSLVLAVVLQERGVWLSLNDIVDSLLVVRAGQFLLIVIALALFIYGLKHIRLVK